jgi:delta 1-pyrroline-5-carboxylate dehydrogenase
MNAQLKAGETGDFRLLIGGKLVAGAGSFDVINPATEQVLASCPRADLAQLNQAVAAAKGAFPAWAATPLAERDRRRANARRERRGRPLHRRAGDADRRSGDRGEACAEVQVER